MLNYMSAGLAAAALLIGCLLDLNFHIVKSALEPKAPVYSRDHDIEKWKLAKTEIPSYDACQAALASTTGAVASVAYCGCLVVAGATSLQTLAPSKLRPLLAASFAASPVPPNAKSAVPSEIAGAVESGSPGCRTPEETLMATGSTGGGAGGGWRIVVRSQSNSGDSEARKLPLLSDHRY